MTNKPQFVGERVRVSDAFDLRMGKTPSRKNLSYWRDGNHDWVSIADLGSFGKYVGSTKERINDVAISETGIKPAPANTVLMSFKLSLGKTAITTIPVYTNEAIMAFVDKGVYPVDPSFMYHQCRAKDWTADTNAAVMGKTLNKKTLGKQMIFLPGLTEQKTIAKQLDFVEHLLENADEQLYWLNSLVKSRFVEMFDNSCTRVKLSEVCCTYNGDRGKNYPSGNDRADEGIPFVNAGHLVDGKVSFGNMDYITRERYQLLSGGKIRRGDILYCLRGSLGKCGIADFDEGAIASSMMIVRPDSSKVLTHYLYQVLTSADIDRQLKAVRNGSSQPNLSAKNVAQYLIPLPPITLQQQFAAFASQVDKSRFVAQQQIEKLQMLYDSLAQEYFGD